MLTRVKGKLKVTSLTPRPSQLPGMNRRSRRAFYWSKRYFRIQDKIDDIIADINAARPEEMSRVKRNYKIGGKYLTGYYSQLLTIARRIASEDVSEESLVQDSSELPVPFV